jgi:predicted amidohydrolase YtcJ
LIKYDLIVRDCLVVDPLNAVNKVTSVGIAQGKIVETSDGLDGRTARQVTGFPGMVLMPGMIDTHMHCSAWLGGELAFGMLSRAGVTTALDMAGPTTSVLQAMKKRGSGINVAILEAVYPGVSVKDLNPSYDECASLLQKSLAEGAIGLKLLGGHGSFAFAVGGE